MKKLLTFFMLITLVLPSLVAPSSTLAASPGDVVINEVMQNPAAVGDSDGEWFELYNPTGDDIDIDNWTIRDNDIDEHIIQNGGPLIIPAGGYLVLGNNTDQATNGGAPVAYSYGSNWFLSNSADEVILIDASGVEIDRVEYDGGPAFPDPTGASMALRDPSLDNNDGANWCTASTSYGAGDSGTPGAANDCPAPTIEIVINEIMQNPSIVADSVGEWFELYNPTAADIDINGWTIADNDFDEHLINNGGALLVPAGGYLVLGNSDELGINGGAPVAYSYGGDMFLSNGADEIVLIDAAGIEIDRVEYDGGATFPDPTGASMALRDPALDNNDGANWCEASTPYGAGDLGTPGAANDCPLPTTELVINEIMQNPAAVFDSAGEWFELFNPTDNNIDIDGWTIRDNDFDSHVITNGGPLLVPAGGYLVLGRNADIAANGGVNVAYEYSSFFLGNGGDELVLEDGSSIEIDRVEYDGGPIFPDPTGASMSLRDPALDNNVGANWCTSATPFGDGDLGTPGAANVCSNIGLCGEPATYLVWEIQGNAAQSTLVGMPAIIEGVVVGDFQNNGQPDDGDLNGFYVQEEDNHTDGDATTSDGIFIYAPAAPDVSTGDLVRVGGSVAEYETSGGLSSLTQISNVSEVLDCGSAPTVPEPTAVTLPVSDVSDFERYEGMLVTFAQPLYISEYYNFDRFGEIVLTTSRQYQPTAIFEPGSIDAANLAQVNSLSRITLDDGRSASNPDPALHPNGAVFDLTNLFRGGDVVQNATGVIDDAFGLYRIQPTQGADYTSVNERPLTPDPVGDNLKVVAFNVLNYFTTLDYPSGHPLDNTCGPLQDQGCRGADADQPDEFTRQRDKIIAALASIDADVVGLIEIENHPGDVPTADLVEGLNAVVGADTYDYVATGAIGADAIRVALIYKPATVSLVGDYAVLDDPSFTDPLGYGDEKSRPALAQTFMDNSTGGIFTAVVNHLKSKGTPCGPGDDDPEQGSCNLTRTLGAQALVDWLASNPTGSGDSDFLIIGDLNSYDKEDPIDALVAGGYTDLLFQYIGEDAYSYVFDGQLGYLDYGMANGDLVLEVTGATAWHINADEPDILDYDTSFKKDAQDALYEPNAYRASDHDPVIVGLDLNPSPVCNAAYPSIDTLWPVNHKFVSVNVLGVTHPEDDTVTITIDRIFQDEPVNGTDDGDTAPDGQGIGTATAEVRAERDGLGNGRVYHIYFTARDSDGDACTGEINVGAPLSQGEDGAPIDDGPLYDSTVIVP